MSVTALAEEVCFGPFRLDRAARRLTRNGAPVALGDRAFEVLLALVDAEGAVVSKADLLRCVWPSLAVEENNLHVQVYALRRALGEDGEREGFIRTAPGRGYRFVARRPDPQAAAEADRFDAPPQEVRYIRTRDGVHLAVARTGDGPPLVRAGVWMSHVEHDWRTSVWARFLGALSERHTLIRYDARGMGLSDRDAPVSFEAAVGDLEAVIDSLGFEQVSLLGISFGGAVAVAYAARHPQRVARIVTAGAFVRGTIAAQPELRDRVEAMATLFEVGWATDNPAFRNLVSTLGFPSATPRQLDEINELQLHSATGAKAAELMRMSSRSDASAMAPNVRCPTLILHSRGDAWVPCERSREMARLIPGSRFMELPGANHIILPQDPAFGAYLGEIAEFLAGADTGRR